MVSSGLFENDLECTFNTCNAADVSPFLFSPVSLGITVWMEYYLGVFVNPANAMGMQLNVIFKVFAL